jgi:hypothetical protein
VKLIPGTLLWCVTGRPYQQGPARINEKNARQFRKRKIFVSLGEAGAVQDAEQ